jgi:hypothetical protein
MTAAGFQRGRPRLPVRRAPCSNSASTPSRSWRSPPVRCSATGRPWASARRCSLLEKPPRERPNACSLAVCRAPAAWAWARITLLSSRWCTSQPASGAMARSSATTRPQTPAAVQRWSRRQAVRQFISSGGRSRQGEPVRASQRTASRNRRWSMAGRPVLGFWGGSSGERRCHIAPLSMVLIVTPPRCDQITPALTPLATRPSTTLTSRRVFGDSSRS